MSFPDHYYLGTIVRLYGFKGEVYVKLDVDYPQDYLDMDSVFIDLDNNLVPFFIQSSQFGSKGMLRVKFDGIESESDAKPLIRKNLFLPKEILEASEVREFFFHEIIGFEVKDQQSGRLGMVSEVLEYPGNPIMKVERGEEDILIPIQDAFLVSVDKQKKIIEVDLPEGMLDMNT